MPNRVLRDGILSSERIAALGWAEEVFYRRLHSVVDDYGRFHAHHSLLRAACYPLQLEKVSDSDIGKWLLATEKAGLVRVYPAKDGKRYLEVEDFGQRIQGKSKFPEPICSASTVDHGGPPETTVSNGDPPESTAVVGVEGVVEDGGVKPPRRARRTSPKTPLPEGFEISDRVRKWAEGKGFDRLEAHFEAFVSKARAKGYAYADWDEGFMGAVRDDWAELRKPCGQPQARQRRQL